MPSAYRNHEILDSYQLEKHFKGIGNHTRIDILILLAKNKGINLDMIMEKLDVNYHTLSGHIGKLTYAGLVYKKLIGKNLELSLSPYGKIISEFILEFMYR